MKTNNQTAWSLSLFQLALSGCANMSVRIEWYTTYLAMEAASHSGVVLPPVVDPCQNSMVVEPRLFWYHWLWPF